MEPILGTMFVFAGNFAPPGYKFCNGELLPIAEYKGLYSVLGTTYGGDGEATFALPDLRGKCPVGVGSVERLGSIELGASGTSDVVFSTLQLTGKEAIAEGNGESAYLGVNYIIAVDGSYSSRY